MSCPRKHPNGAARPGCRSDGPQHEEQGFVLWNQRYATGGEPVQAKPCGRALPGLDRTSPFAFCSTHAKRSQTNNRTFHLLFKPDILTCYEQRECRDSIRWAFQALITVLFLSDEDVVLLHIRYFLVTWS